ncbi:MAG TPA: S8 family serine peptidase [Gemmatimonadaceae bacterium]|nr:S8 family serine peptidase [Gemmatimonadaceae bacterium]
MTKRATLSVLAVAVLAACSDQPTSVRRSPDLAPSKSAAAAAQLAGPRFIVTVVPRENPSAVARDHGVAPDFVYTHALNGFAGSISDAARSGLLRDARVTLVEPDGIAEAWDAAASWGLDRIDQRSLPLSGTYTYGSTGAGVTAYIIDTGIWTTHADFGGRASVGFDAIGDGRNGIDCHGHGTHVAGTVGGATYGVAKGVTLKAVRVLNCFGSGTWSQVIAGMDWVAGNRVLPAVANMSLGGGASSSVDAAVRGMIAKGVATAVAAGNGNAAGIGQDACRYSPARVAEAMTIGATSSTDTKASWSNYGKCVDFFAPGVAITSDWLNGGTATISGTSMATPHTTGVAAQYLALNTGATPAAVSGALAANTTKGVVKNSKTANNHLLFTNY